MWLRATALSSLRRGGDDRSAALLRDWVRSSDPELRAAATGLIDPEAGPESLETLRSDPARPVRRVAIERSLEQALHLEPWILDALGDVDPRVRRSALEWAIEHPVIDPEVLIEVVSEERSPHPAMTALRALGARAAAQPLERGELIVVIEHLARHPDFLVRREAGNVLADLGRPRPSSGAASKARTTATYRDIVLQTVQRRRLAIRTDRGTVEVELWCPRTPLTCLNFMQLARQGFYDGRRFEGGSPARYVTAGGDGAGFTIRDEKAPAEVEKGTLAMLRSVPDTAATEFVLSAARNPDLDDRALPFGHVLVGQEIVDDLVPGDTILRIEALDQGTATFSKRPRN